MQESHVLANWKAKANQVCMNANISLTPKRLAVYTTLLKARYSLSAYELITQVEANFQIQLTPISIYRMLEFLEDNHLVRKLKSAGKYLAISPNKQIDNEHVLQFLICRQCGDVKELEVEQRIMTELKSCIDMSGFHLNNLELELDCICVSCSP